MDDEIEEYYPSGKLKSTISFKDGVRHGHQNIYYETGELMYEGEWGNDQQEGVWKLYHETGELKRENIFDNHEKVSLKEYNMEGNLILEELELEYDKTNNTRYSIRKTYFDSGVLKMESKLKNIGSGYFLYGPCKEYYEGGQLMFEGEYDGDIKSGTWKFYYNSNKIKRQEIFDDRRILVLEKNWDQNGRLINEKKLEIDDLREILSLVKEFRPEVKYFTQFEYQKGYSQTNETSLNLSKVDYDVNEDIGDGEIGMGVYETGKTLYDDTVYECEMNVLKLDSFIDLLSQYIELKGKDYDDWSFETFFEWFQETDNQQIFDKAKWNSTLGYTQFEQHDITWCCGFNNFNYHGININNIKNENKIFSFSGVLGDYDGQ